uniref:Phospholipase D2 n=1 Tax=Lepisosteus oculatus TaxID=7918 RepID=W5N7K7_LEPOC
MASPEEDVVEATQATVLTRRLHRDDLPISEDELDCLREATDERPFLVIHHLQAVREKGVPLLLRDTPVTCKVDSTERHTTRSKTGHCYPLSFICNHITDPVKRKYRHFQELHRDLHSHKLMVNFLPLGRFAAERQQLGTMADELPTLHGADRARRASSKPKLLEDYLNVLLENSFCRNYHGMTGRCVVSHSHFLQELVACSETAVKEGFILKRSGGHRILGLNCFGHHQFCYRWSRRWLVVKDSFLLYMKPEAGVISFVLLFDPEFKVQVGRCYTDTKYGVCIQNFTRTLVIKCSSYRQAQWWSHEIHRLSEPCEFLQTHRFDSFAPPREDTLARWYINGREYFADVAQALEQAREEIFITDWWLSPEIYLKRPATSHYWRLDQILKRKAVRTSGVTLGSGSGWGQALGQTGLDAGTVLLLGWCGVRLGSGLDWGQVLGQAGVKLVLGSGLDWVSLSQSGDVVDSPGESNPVPETQGSVSDQRQVSPEDLTDNTRLWLGKDYSNFITKDWVQLDRPFEDNIDRTVVPRMPWRDMAAVVHGKAARDLSRHFIQRWNFTKIFKNKYKDDFYPCLLPKSHSAADSLPFIVPQTRSARVQILRSVDRWSAGTCECSIHRAYIDTIESSEHYVYIENQFFISCSDEKSVFNRIGDALVDRILRAHRSVYGHTHCSALSDVAVSASGAESSSAFLFLLFMNMVQLQHTVPCHPLAGSLMLIIVLILLLFICLMTTRCFQVIYSIGADDNCGSATTNTCEESSNTTGEVTLPCCRVLMSRVLLAADSDPCIDIQDPISDEFFQGVWNRIAESNADIYDMVFRSLPSNSIHNLRMLREYVSVERMAETDPDRAREELAGVRGYLVHFPLHFLCEEYLLPPLKSKERMVPMEVWT